MAYGRKHDPATQDTRFTFTDGDVNPQRVELFLVDRTSGVAAAGIACLVGNQTSSFKTSSVEPGSTGYAVAVAVNGTTGCPIGTEGNELSGMVHVKRSDGFRGTLPAIAVSALYGGTIAGCTGASQSASLPFDGTSYNRLPRVVSLDNFPSRGDGESTRLVADRLGGDPVQYLVVDDSGGRAALLRHGPPPGGGAAYRSRGTKRGNR